ncbi:peptidoglycan DD-metalloendopeptidase family protein [bacterium]|nr:peptidoglycan DD-metalloendopeptidase family protein [bacterium]
MKKLLISLVIIVFLTNLYTIPNMGIKTKLSTAQSAWTGIVTARIGLNVRDGEWGTIVGLLHCGDIVNVIGEKGEWYKIDYNGSTKFVHKNYIDKNIAASSEKEFKPPKKGTVQVGNSYLNVRMQPWGNIVGKFYTAQRVTCTHQRGEWYKIEYLGSSAYVHSNYVLLDADKGKLKSKEVMYVTANTLNVRKSPWGTILGRIHSGDRVEIIGKEGDWSKITYNGKTAYVHSNHLSKNNPLNNTQPPVASGPVGKGWGGRPCAAGYVSSKFGMRKHPITGAYKMHSGVDIGAPRGTNCISLGPGKVIYVSYCGGYGKLVKIKHDNGYESRYAHLDSYAGMTVGKRVGQNEVCGKVDSTGSSTGHHLHFELRKGGTALNPQNVPGVKI